jgi:hypothetical protein
MSDKIGACIRRQESTLTRSGTGRGGVPDTSQKIHTGGHRQ